MMNQPKQLTYSEQRLVTDEVLSVVGKLIDPYAVVAGGAPRDWDAETTAKDVDVFIHASTCNVKEILRVALTDEAARDEPRFSGYWNGDVVGVGQNVKYEGLSLPIIKITNMEYKNVMFQFIQVDTKATEDFRDLIINSIDIGLCRISYSIKPNCSWGSLEKTREYTLDRNSHTLTLYIDSMTADQLTHCLNCHLKKMTKRFSDYEIAIKYENPVNY